MKIQRRVYLDNNASTRVDSRVVEYINEIYKNHWAIPSSEFSHTPGIKAKDIINNAREIIKNKINGKNGKIIFTSGGTEANNLAILGIAKANNNQKRNKIIVSSIEHFSVIQTAMSLSPQYEIHKINVDNEGFVDIEHLKSLIDDKTLLVSVMYANHEVGTVQNIKEISNIAKGHGAYMHTDACAAFLQCNIDVEDDGIDLMSISSHKVYGPKGIGALFVHDGINIKKIMYGGYNEFDLRPGSENVEGIGGFGKAVEIYSDMDNRGARDMRDYLYRELVKNIDGIRLNGAKDFTRRLANNLNISFDYIEGEAVVLHLDMRGIAVITGSACFSRSLEASHVLLAMGFSHERAHGSIRFSTSKYTTIEDIDYTINHVREVVEKLREMSPLKQN